MGEMAVAAKKAPTRKRRKGASRTAAVPSFTLKAAITLIGYWVGYLPGLIMNFIFLSEARKVGEERGQSPAGLTWLRVMLCVFFWLPLLLFLLVGTGLILLVRLDR